MVDQAQSRRPAGGGRRRARAHADARRADFTRATLIVLGSEGQGLPPALVESADVRVSIPMTPPVESLNVAVAAALLVYEARRQRDHNRDGTKARRRDDEFGHDSRSDEALSKRFAPSCHRAIVIVSCVTCGSSRHDRPRPLRRRRPLPHGHRRPGRAAGRADAAAHARRGRRTGGRARAGGAAAPGDRGRRAAVADLLGPARHRQDDHRAADRRTHAARASWPSAPCCRASRRSRS